MSFEKTYKSYGDQAILVEWQPKIADAILKDMNQFKHKIEIHLKAQVLDVVMGYHSLLVKYKTPIKELRHAIESLQKIATQPLSIKPRMNYLWEIPVCCDEEFGIDLAGMAKTHQLSISEIISLHTAPVYTVYFIGFLPGFLYLGGLNERLAIPRKETPRLQVAARSVAIGGNQTGVYPSDSAGGWQIIGKTPLSFFDVKANPPCFASSGDQIKFVSITAAEFKRLEDQNITPKKLALL